MDPFTERILQKAEQRSKNLGISKTAKYPLSQVDGGIMNTEAGSTNTLQVVQKKVEVENLSDYASPTKVKRQFSVDKENRDLGIEINITTGPNVEVQVAVEEHDIDSSSDSSIEKPVKVRETFRNRLQKLGALYSNNDDLSSPIHRTEGKFHENSGPVDSRLKRPIPKFGKLVALAESIKNWEDDTSHPDYKHFKTIADIQSPTKKIPKIDDKINNKKSDSHETTTNNDKNVSNTKKLKWDKHVTDSLEAQGFQRRDSSTTKFSYEYKSTSSDDSPGSRKKFEQTIVTGNDPKNISVSNTYKTGIVSGRAAAYESKVSDSPKKIAQKDPAEMTLKERMQFFEKNKGEALMPKAAFGMAAPVNKFNENKFKRQDNIAKPIQYVRDFGNNTESESSVRGKVAALIASTATISENQIKADLMKQREHDMNILAKRYQRQEQNTTKSTPPPPPPPPPMATNTNTMPTNKRRSNSVGKKDNYENDIVKADEKRPKTSSNRLYPILSDLESTESDIGNNYTTATVSGTSDDEKHRYSDELTDSFAESENDDSVGICNVSLGREIMQAVHTNEARDVNKRKEVRYADQETYHGDSSINSYASDGLNDYLDEALEDNDTDESNSENDLNMKTAKGTKTSNSFCYQKQPKKYIQTQKIDEEGGEYIATTSKSHQYEPVKSALSVNRSDDNDMVTLVHTVSFYRKQQSSNSNNSTPVRKVSREQQHARVLNSSTSEETTEIDVSDESGSERDDTNIVQEKIKKLLDEVCKQQQVIGQTSQALNLCAATIEFSGSTESVEGERHLLVATHRRQAALDEVQRLRVERSIRPRGAPKEKGRLTVREITIPLRQDYIRKLSSDTISGHHLVCLLKYNENVLATKTVPTLPGLLAVKFPDVLQLNNVYADFKITVEVYGMTAQREVLPHEVKYHINLNKKSGVKTPKKKASDSKLVMPMMQSPAGPNVVRTPALVQYGFTIFSLREIQRNTWTLNQVTGVSPLDGVIHMKVNCELSVSVEYKGFLTMFEDISGFGAWHRRWCYLNGHVLSYWKYPDDERKKTPLASIDLYTCCSAKIKTAPRDICARLNTMLLECQRPAKENDTESLLIVPKGKTTIVRNLLSADTKEERDEWCAYFNKALTLIRAWGPQ